MHFSFVEFAITVSMRINASSWAPKIIRSFTAGISVLHNNFVYRSIDVTQAMTQRTSGLKRKLTDRKGRKGRYFVYKPDKNQSLCVSKDCSSQELTLHNITQNETQDTGHNPQQFDRRCIFTKS